MDERARELERKARRTGERADWTAYLANLRLGEERVRETCYALLDQDPSGARQPALEKLVETGGVWIELDDRRDGYLHVHGLCDQTGANQQPYTLSLAQKYFEHPEHDRIHSITGEQMFTQPTLARLLATSEYQPPTTKQLDALSRALVIAQANNRQPQLTAYASNMLRTDIFSDINTSTHVNYDGKNAEIVHGFRADAERIRGVIAFEDCPFRGIRPEFFPAFAGAVLGTIETEPTVTARYQTLLSLTTEPYVSLPVTAFDERAVHFWVAGQNNDMFFIDLNRSYMGSQPARLVKSTPIVTPN